jgi:integrase
MYFPARAALQETFQEARRRAVNGKLAGDEALRIIQAWFRETDRKAATADFGLFGEILHAALAETEQDLCSLIEGDDGEGVQAALDRALIAAGWPSRAHVVGSIATRRVRVADLDDHSGQIPAELHDLARRALIEAARRRLDRLQGRPGAPVDPLFANGAAVQPVANGQDTTDRMTVGELIAEFTAERAPGLKAKTMLDYGMLFRALKELWGERKPVRSITRADCRQVRDLFAALPPNAEKRWPGKTLAHAAEQARAAGIAPMHPRTANKHVYRLSTMLKWAMGEEHADRNPALGLRVAAPKSDPRDARRPFSIEQLRKIFSAPLYTGCKDDQAGYAEPGTKVVRRGRFWLPLIALYAGARMNELAQLGTADVALRDGAHVLSIKPDPETGQTVKTEAGRRLVPVHPELVRCGFLDFVARQRLAGHHRLFPELKQDARGYYSDHFQKWFSRFLAKAGATAPRTSFHSFRHNFRDALREANVSRDATLALGGWKAGGTEEIYGGGLRASTLDRELTKVNYPGLDLSHLHRPAGHR